MDRHKRHGGSLRGALLLISAAILANGPSLNSRTSAASNQAPTGALTAPLNTDRYDAPANIVLQASASDDVGVVRVDFYADGTLIGSDTSKPYEFLWTSVSAGIRQVV